MVSSMLVKSATIIFYLFLLNSFFYFSINTLVSFIPVIEINNSCSLFVYNKKRQPFVSDYKRDIFDKYTLIYWIQESYPSIFVFFSGDTFV